MLLEKINLDVSQNSQIALLIIFLNSMTICTILSMIQTDGTNVTNASKAFSGLKALRTNLATARAAMMK